MTNMSYDQLIQILDTLGTWVAGLGTILAAAIALWLARRAERVRLKAYVDLNVMVGDGKPLRECLIVRVTNLGERPVTIDSVGWRVGKRRKRRFAMNVPASDECPKRIEHGQSFSFVTLTSENSLWIEDFVNNFISDLPMKTLRAQIHTSIGHTENVKPGNNFMKMLQEMHISKTQRT